MSGKLVKRVTSYRVRAIISVANGLENWIHVYLSL